MKYKNLEEYIEKWHVSKVDWDGQEELQVLGVSNVEGITTTTHKKSKDLSKYLVIEPGCFAYNPYRINVGSIGLTPANVYGLVSPAYTVFKVKKNKVLPELLLDFLKSFDGLQQINKYARGTVRKALRYEDLCKINVSFPSFKEQLRILDHKKEVEEKSIQLNNEIEQQWNDIGQLKQSILQEAIQGKLTQEWREQNPNAEPASELLKRIKAEKARLIKDKKIKKEKPLPPIIDEEIPFDLPRNWEWCKLGEMYEIVRGSSPRPKGDPRYWSNGRTSFHWITIADFKPFTENGCLIDTKGFLTEEGSKHSRKVGPSDIIIACSGVGSVGKSVKLGIEGYIYMMVCLGLEI
ncbi:restriction endonuclease subunit S [Parvicella tangerina]|uniref:Type I restriction modification DNA specificity domain-containing protein n=1 Tax=Parvicella tangerina TaxID=2829795 RepID=A0A916JQ74_9FLAO|nr:restriction endonuclease subunit S [Parvicella tangerina]CAG5086019.1 hypothetical protein CRYO30217_02979 [Parvicella tangerina]